MIALAAEVACIGLSVGTAAVLCIFAGKVLGQLLIDKLADASRQGGCLPIRFGRRWQSALARCQLATHDTAMKGSGTTTSGDHCHQGSEWSMPITPPTWWSGARSCGSRTVTSSGALGYDWSKVESLSREALQQFEDVPIDGTLVKERSDSHTFVISGRHRWWVQDREQFDKNHFDKDVHIVANGSLVSAPYAGPLP